MIKIYKYGEVPNSEIFARDNIASNVSLFVMKSDELLITWPLWLFVILCFAQVLVIGIFLYISTILSKLLQPWVFS